MGVVFKIFVIFITFSKLCLALGLSLCLLVRLMFGIGFVCLYVSWTSVWHWVCLFPC